MEKESIYELQKLDCNCNDCKFMDRDMIEFNLWKGFHVYLQYVEFIRNRKAVWKAAEECINRNKKDYCIKIDDLKTAKLFEERGRKMKFQFDSSYLTIGYGVCLNRKGRFSQPITFIPNTIQLHTQQCFVHRKN